MRQTSLNGFSLEKGTFIKHLATCMTCRMPWRVEVNRYQRIADAFYRDGFESLRQKTFPGIEQAYAGRLELEARRQAGTLSMDEREMLVREAFDLSAERTDDLFEPKKFHSGRRLLWLLAILIPVIGGSFRQISAPWGMFWNIILLAVLAGVLIRQHRYAQAYQPDFLFEKEVLPGLARLLGPLRPRSGEMIAELKRLKDSGRRLGEMLDWDRLEEELRLVDLGR